MSRNGLPEEPLFQNRKNSDIEDSLTIEEIKAKEEIQRKNKLLHFSFSSFYVMMIAILVIIIFDIAEQKLNIDHEILSQTFELIKYATTTILGFLFASNSK